MKKITTVLILLVITHLATAQFGTVFHSSSFKKFKGIMRSNPYKADPDEKVLATATTKAIFPSDVQKNQTAYIDTLVQWVGIVKDVTVQDRNDSSDILFTLDQKYWDYIEDYSIQDEVMFVSPMGEGGFHLSVTLKLTEDEKEQIKKMPDDKTLFICYGKIIADDKLPALKASYVKMVAYKYYSTAIFSYTIERDADGHLVKNKNGGVELTDFKMLKIAGRGQNKD